MGDHQGRLGAVNLVRRFGHKSVTDRLYGRYRADTDVKWIKQTSLAVLIFPFYGVTSQIHPGISRQAILRVTPRRRWRHHVGRLRKVQNPPSTNPITRNTMAKIIFSGLQPLDVLKAVTLDYLFLSLSLSLNGLMMEADRERDSHCCCPSLLTSTLPEQSHSPIDSSTIRRCEKPVARR